LGDVYYIPIASIGCVRFDIIQAMATGHYLEYGIEYYKAYPLLEDKNCKTYNLGSVKQANLCFE
jgi:hypothetical protein